MATPTIKSTYALDVDTVRTLEMIARRWGVSKSEALRRAIRSATHTSSKPDDALAALDALQSSLALSHAKAESWARRARAERGAGSRRAEGRW